MPVLVFAADIIYNGRVRSAHKNSSGLKALLYALYNSNRVLIRVIRIVTSIYPTSTYFLYHNFFYDISICNIIWAIVNMYYEVYLPNSAEILDN